MNFFQVLVPCWLAFLCFVCLFVESIVSDSLAGRLETDVIASFFFVLTFLLKPYLFFHFFLFMNLCVSHFLTYFLPSFYWRFWNFIPYILAGFYGRFLHSKREIMMIVHLIDCLGVNFTLCTRIQVINVLDNPIIVLFSFSLSNSFRLIIFFIVVFREWK